MSESGKRLAITKEICNKVSCTSLVTSPYKDALLRLNPKELIQCNEYLKDNYSTSKISSTALCIYLSKSFNGKELIYKDPNIGRNQNRNKSVKNKLKQTT